MNQNFTDILVVAKWADERNYYTYSTGACTAVTCNHYMQVRKNLIKIVNENKIGLENKRMSFGCKLT